MFVPLAGGPGEDNRGRARTCGLFGRLHFWPISKAKIDVRGQMPWSVCGAPLGHVPCPFGHGGRVVSVWVSLLEFPLDPHEGVRVCCLERPGHRLGPLGHSGCHGQGFSSSPGQASPLAQPSPSRAATGDFSSSDPPR
jgi:hypothetical protein